MYKFGRTYWTFQHYWRRAGSWKRKFILSHKKKTFSDILLGNQMPMLVNFELVVPQDKETFPMYETTMLFLTD